MIKSMFKRTWLSIIRKPSKTIVLAIILFVMANLVLASISIKKAVNESTNFAKASLGSMVYLSPDMDLVREDAISKAEGDADGKFRVRLNIPTVPLETVAQLADSTYVKDLTYGISARATEIGFEVVSNEGATFRPGNFNIADLGSISIQGINAYDFITEVRNKQMEIVEGEAFDETKDNEVLIAFELAEQNGLKVGEAIKLKNTDTNKEYKLKVSGIYDVSTDYNANTIYMNVATAAQFLSAEAEQDGNYGVNDVIFFLNNPGEADAFIAEANSKEPNLSANKLALSVNSDSYEQMVGPIEQVGSFADTVLIFVVLASVVIITLITNNNIKERKYEIGVLMSLGGTKKNIIGQMLCELAIVAAFGFIASIGSSYFLASTMGEALLAKQVAISKQENTGANGRANGPMGGNIIAGGPVGGMRNASAVAPIDKINVSVGVNDYLILFGSIYAIIILAMIVPAVNITKYEPKTILTGRQ